MSWKESLLEIVSRIEHDLEVRLLHHVAAAAALTVCACKDLHQTLIPSHNVHSWECDMLQSNVEAIFNKNLTT